MSAVRVDELLSKLLHSSPSISRRAASNLRQKLASGLLELDDDAVLYKLAEAVAHSLQGSAAEQIDSSEADIGMQEGAIAEIVPLCCELARSCNAAPTAVIKAGCIEALAALQQQRHLSASLSGAVERALQQLEVSSSSSSNVDFDSSQVAVHQPGNNSTAHDRCAVLGQQSNFELPAATPTAAAVIEAFSAAGYGHSGSDATLMATCLTWPGWTKELVAGSSLLTVGSAAALREVLCSGWTLPAVKVSATVAAMISSTFA
jgi:hypothetical protein